MNSKLKRYAVEQLASTGFVLLEHTRAFQLRPDIWATPSNCMSDMLLNEKAEIALTRLGARLFVAKVPGERITLRGATRSMLDIGKRIQQITGIVVTEVTMVSTFNDEVAAKLLLIHPQITTPVKQVNTAKLKEIAATELPLHDCALRSQILKARSDLAESGLVN